MCSSKEHLTCSPVLGEPTARVEACLCCVLRLVCGCYVERDIPSTDPPPPHLTLYKSSPLLLQQLLKTKQPKHEQRQEKLICE